MVEPDFPVAVNRLDIRGGTMDFADFVIRPSFGAKIEGELTPLQYDRRTKIDMAFRNMELPVFNPFSARWAGYSIAKGKLMTALGHTIDNRALDAAHHIVIGLLDQKIAAAAMAREVKKGEKADLAALDLDKRHDRLEDLYKARFKTGPKYPEPEAKEEGDARKQRETDWLMAELRKSYAPSPDELAALGRARAEAVRLTLLEGATPVDPARVFLSGRDSASEKDGKARMELKLEGS